MATPRKRPSSGFTEKSKEQSVEKQEIEEFLETAVTEVIEAAEKVEEKIEEQVIPEIVPTEDAGPRFVTMAVAEKLPEPVTIESVKPKRHPRNIPRFSRTSK